ncbi:alpha-mannosidase [Georgenia subflava]|uniref:Alpha-mannosidase n=1 Tax=Georgenia subflava TaxID=1622177 RepID=A0A6N7EFY1_9MICO|nr:alpha-mannosidase [Georgenia subflava]
MGGSVGGGAPPVGRGDGAPVGRHDGAPLAGEPVPFAEAVRAEYAPFAVGSAWGRPWSTTWFHVTGTVPADWSEPGTRPELVVDLGFTDAQSGFQAEGTAYTPDGVIIKAVEPRNRYVPLPDGPGSAVDLYLEAAANPDLSGGWRFAPTPLGDRATAGAEPVYRLEQLAIGLLDETVWQLVQDVVALHGLMEVLPADSTRRAVILRALERAVDAVDPDDVAGTAAAGRAALEPALASPAHASAHQVVAVGHAHIDSAWLWPTRETRRKVARTFSNVLALMEDSDDLVFAASSAQQYAWLKEDQPELFARLKEQVARGRFVPVGGMWVESDTNLPGGEAMARQLVAGTRFFRDELGVDQPEVWLPDSFGYSAALPQIMRAAGARWFLTQKISWNETNKHPHHTFWWEGIDGTRIFTHFPPVDTYGAELSAVELARAERQYAEKGAGTTSLVPFGWGDGGGGPTREMLAAAARTKDLEGSPAVTLGSPREFFERAQAEYQNPPVWSGELYLEFHRGTYTSQARTKAGNRRSEHLLREAELWASAAAVRTGAAYPYEQLERAWHTVLLNQFHDILPGSSIAWVHQEAERRYAEVAADLETVIAESLTALVGDGETPLLLNAGPRPVAGVPALAGATAARTAGGAEPGGVTPDGGVAPDGGHVLANAHVRVTVDARGLITSIHDLAADREVVPPGQAANLLQIFRDTPNQWDAWDIDEHYRRHGRDLDSADTVEVVESDHGPTIRVVRTVGASTITQQIGLRPDQPTVDLRTTVDWHERQKLLKLAFPLDVHAERAASEIQFGHVHRPTHANTSWDAARFETVAHRWVHVGEPGYGVAVANDSVYGHDITRATRDGGGTTTLVRLSLLRAPLFPDPSADQGEHTFSVSLRVGAGIEDAISEGYRLNVPLRATTGAHAVEPLLSVDNPAVVVEAVKLAEDRSGDVVVRLYEAHGGRATATLTAGFPVGAVIETDLHEQPVEATSLATTADGGIRLRLRPFQLITLRLTPQHG